MTLTLVLSILYNGISFQLEPSDLISYDAAERLNAEQGTDLVLPLEQNILINDYLHGRIQDSSLRAVVESMRFTPEWLKPVEKLDNGIITRVIPTQPGGIIWKKDHYDLAGLTGEQQFFPAGALQIGWCGLEEIQKESPAYVRSTFGEWDNLHPFLRDTSVYFNSQFVPIARGIVDIVRCRHINYGTYKDASLRGIVREKTD